MSLLGFESKPCVQASCVGSYTNLFATNRVEVLYSPQGLLARVISFDAGGKIANIIEGLPLIWMPKELSKKNDVATLRGFFSHTRLTPEKGENGFYNRVSVSVIGKGGGKSVIPFQPGLALGSVVKCDTLDKMELYSKKLAQISAYEEQIKNAEQQIEALLTKISARDKQLHPLPPTPPAPSATPKSTTSSSSSAPPAPALSTDKAEKKDTLIQVWEKQIKSLESFIERISAKLLNEPSEETPATGKRPEEKDEEIPVFEGFQQGLASPIDMSASRIENQVRSFDSLKFSSQYLNLREDSSEIRNKIDQSSSASSFSAQAGWAIWKVGVNHARTEAIANRVQEIKKAGKTEGVWIVNAMATTRYVRGFTQIVYDKQRLQHILDAMNSKNLETEKRFGISSGSDGQKEIYLLTEAVLGGSFTALVTFYEGNTMQRTAADREKQNNSSTSITAGGGGTLGAVLLKGAADVAFATGSASKSEEDVLQSLAQTRVNIEFFSEGTIPVFTRSVLEREITKHLNLNPSNFQLTPQDEAEANQLIEGQGTAKQLAALKRQMKLENAQVATVNTYRGLTSEKEQQNIHTMESVMVAYENFAKKITEDPDCGVPVGFNYTVLTQKMIESHLGINPPGNRGNAAGAS